MTKKHYEWVNGWIEEIVERRIDPASEYWHRQKRLRWRERNQMQSTA